jgi:hypothetical protein
MENESFKNEEQLIKKVIPLTDLAAEELELEKACLMANPELLVRLAEWKNSRERKQRTQKEKKNREWTRIDAKRVYSFVHIRV